MKYILVILATALLFGRPGAGQHKDAVAKKAANILDLEAEDVLYNAAITAILDKHIVVHDFYIFSVAEVQGQVLSIGALRLVYVRTEMLTINFLRL